MPYSSRLLMIDNEILSAEFLFEFIFFQLDLLLVLLLFCATLLLVVSLLF